MRLANEQRLQRLNYEGLVEIPRETVTRIRPHIQGLTPPPSFRSWDGSGCQGQFEVSNSQDVTHQCHSSEEVDTEQTPREIQHSRKKVVNSFKDQWGLKELSNNIFKGNSIM